MDNALQCVDGESYFARSALELSDTRYKKHQLRCDHSVTISQRSGRFRNGVVYIWLAACKKMLGNTYHMHYLFSMKPPRHSDFMGSF